MIGGRLLAVALAAAGLATICLPIGATAPAEVVDAERHAWLTGRARHADRALAQLQTELEAALVAARSGAALVVDGDDDPEPDLLAAADDLAAAAPAAGVARARLADARGVARALDGAPQLGSLAGPTDLTGIAGQLRAAAEAAGPFVARRRAAAATVEGLGDALEALDDDDPAMALEAVDAAEAALREVEDWEEPPATLPVWLETMAALLAATRDLAGAMIAGDPEAAEAASRAYRAAAEAANRADMALAISIAEAGSALTGVPLRRLAEALAAVADQRAALATLLGPPRVEGVAEEPLHRSILV